MRYSSALIGLLASTSGLVAVYYWWKAARMGPIDVPAGAPPKGGPGDMYFECEGDKAIYLNYSRQSKWNAMAAGWTGISVLLQTFAILAQITLVR
jgi:hypothetical protein